MNEMEDKTMTEDVMTLLNNVVTQHHEKIMYEREQRVDKEAREEIARSLKNFLNDEDIAVSTGLSLEKVRKL